MWSQTFKPLILPPTKLKRYTLDYLIDYNTHIKSLDVIVFSSAASSKYLFLTTKPSAATAGYPKNWLYPIEY